MTYDQARDQAAANGHHLRDDPPFASAARRATCEDCGYAVLVCSGNAYGSAIEFPCRVAKEATS